MSTTLSQPLLGTALVSWFIYLFFLVKQGKLSGLSFKTTKSEWRTFGITLLSVGAFLGSRAFFSPADALSTAIIFLVALTTPFLLRRLNWNHELLQSVFLILIIIFSIGFNSILGLSGLLSALLGLLTYKILENLLFSKENRLDDIAPACIWLAVQCWLILTGNNNPNVSNILFVCLWISWIFEIAPRAFREERTISGWMAISLGGGLSLWIILNKVLLLPKLAGLAALFAAGIFFAYVFANKPGDEEDIDRLSYCTKFLVALGILTVAATRIFGDLGLVVLIPTSIACGRCNTTLLASLFWTGRLLIQAFVSANVANVTGINLMHTYCSAALFFGFLAILFLLAILGLGAKKWFALVALLSTSILVPPAIIYLFHEESAASFLIASLVSAVSLVSFFPFIYKGKDLLLQDNLILVPLLMTTISLLYGPLVQIGNQATVAGRLQLVSAIAVAMLLVYLVFYVAHRITASRKPVSVSRD